jgi:hypothetical protein
MSVSLSLARPVFLASTALLALAASSAPATADKAVIRPIEDFVGAQGTFCFDDGAGGCLLFVPPIANFVGASDPAQDRCASVDYAGLADEWLVDQDHAGLGTTTSGVVLERPLRDGRVEVKVNLHTRDALTWVIQGCDFAGGDLLFGARAPDVAEGAEPALCDSFLQSVFYNTLGGYQPGEEPLPDLLQLILDPEVGQELRAVSLVCNATGELRTAFGVPDGTPGRADIVEIANFRTPARGKGVAGGFPVERIDLHEVGH